jgi:hypothetical protein
LANCSAAGPTAVSDSRTGSLVNVRTWLMVRPNTDANVSVGR